MGSTTIAESCVVPDPYARWCGATIVSLFSKCQIQGSDHRDYVWKAPGQWNAHTNYSAYVGEGVASGKSTSLSCTGRTGQTRARSLVTYLCQFVDDIRLTENAGAFNLSSYARAGAAMRPVRDQNADRSAFF